MFLQKNVVTQTLSLLDIKHKGRGSELRLKNIRRKIYTKTGFMDRGGKVLEKNTENPQRDQEPGSFMLYCKLILWRLEGSKVLLLKYS